MSIQTSPAYVRHEWDDIVGWRIERLLSAGYGDEASLVLALDRDVDLHHAVSLLERGCPVDLALQILF